MTKIGNIFINFSKFAPDFVEVCSAEQKRLSKYNFILIFRNDD